MGKKRKRYRSLEIRRKKKGQVFGKQEENGGVYLISTKGLHPKACHVSFATWRGEATGRKRKGMGKKKKMLSHPRRKRKDTVFQCRSQEAMPEKRKREEHNQVRMGRGLSIK